MSRLDGGAGRRSHDGRPSIDRLPAFDDDPPPDLETDGEPLA